MRINSIARSVGAVTLLMVLGACAQKVGPAAANSGSSDTTLPTVSITSPTTSGTFATTNATVSLAGSASDNVGVTSVTWSNSANGAGGIASGTNSWNIASAALVPGTNAITVTAHDAAGNTRSATLTVSYTASDTTLPTVSITSPTTFGSFATSNPTVSLAGSASDNVGVTSVTWSNAANGTAGAASGTIAWSIASIALVLGTNAITVTAHDAAGNTRTAALTVTYALGGSSLSGNVDSSLISRGDTAVNAVYLYSGAGVTPNDLGSATPPVATAAVTQANGACMFGYQFGVLAAGTYTIAFTNQAANDNPQSDDAITFLGTATVTIAATTTVHDFLPNRRLQVGPTRTGPNTFTVPSAAAAAALNGDVIEIDAGTYDSDAASWGQSRITLRGVNGRAHMNSLGTTVQGKGIWVISGTDVVVENIEFSGAVVPSNNGAGIRGEGSNLTVCNGYLHDNQDGILADGGNILVEYSEFGHNGNCIDPSGCAHNMYIGTGTQRFTLRYSYSHHAHEGHTVKSRALENFILYNRIMDEAAGDSSYNIDIPDAGRTFVIGNLIQQGPNTQNPGMLAYGAESTKNGVVELYVINNTFVNDKGSGQFVSVPGGTIGKIVNNIFAGGGSVPASSGTLTVSNNLISNTPGLVDSANFDYHLTSTSPARDAGTPPGTAGTVNLVPTSQYVHPINRQDRSVKGTAIDIGAYEF